jgi:hypothetical protein
MKRCGVFCSIISSKASPGLSSTALHRVLWPRPEALRLATVAMSGGSCVGTRNAVRRRLYAGAKGIQTLCPAAKGRPQCLDNLIHQYSSVINTQP